MPDPNSSNHWDLLATDLGVKLPAEEAVSQPAESASAASAAASRSRRREPRGRRRLVGHELGFACQQPWLDARAAAGCAGCSRHRRSARCPPVSEPPGCQGRSAATAPPPDTPEESPNFFDERFDFEEPFDLLESSERRAGPGREKDARTKDEAKEKRPRKRRHRRRSGKESEHKDSHEPAPADDGRKPAPSRLPRACGGRGEIRIERPAVAAAEEVGVEEVGA